MNSLLEVPELVMEARSRTMALPWYRFTDPSGVELGTVQDEGQPLRALGRMFSDVPGRGPIHLQVLDAVGNRVLDIKKGKLRRLGGLRVEVGLADGTAVDTVEGKVGTFSGDLALCNRGGESIAGLRLTSNIRYELAGPDGAMIGLITRRMLGRALPPPGVARQYDISFGPGVGIAARCLALAALVSADLRLS